MRVRSTVLHGARTQVVQKLLKTPVPPVRAYSLSATPLKANHSTRKGREACASHNYLQFCYDFKLFITN